jgi:site-specific DNA-cytosine methylase
MNVLSLFDGISSGQIALQRAGIKVDNYYASEIDKNAIKVTQHNWPNTVQLGSVTDVKAENLPKIDILLAGSPCQGFSFAGKQLNFEDPRSKLFFEFVRLLKECGPKYFLLENVKMKKEYENFISEILGVVPIKINSALVSAQNRERLYWTNIPGVCQPKDKGLFLRDVIEEEILTKEETRELDFKTIDFRGFKSENSKKRIIKNFRGGNQKGNCLTASNTNNPAGCGCSNVIRKNSLVWRKISRNECEKLQTIPIGYTNIIQDSPAKHALGNGWTVDVIAHIFKNIPQA